MKKNKISSLLSYFILIVLLLTVTGSISIVQAAPMNDVLQLSVTNTYSGAQNYYYYQKFSTSSYTFQSGDYLEYDVKALNNVDGIGGVDCVTTDSSILRAQAGFQDQNGLIGHPAANISGKAYNVWYHRKMAIPDGMVNKVAANWDIVGECDIPGQNYTAQFDNILITNGSGTVRKVVFRSAADSNINAADIWVNAASAAMTTPNIGLPASPADESMRYEVTNGSTGGNLYYYNKISDAAFTFQSGDYVEYDVKLLTNTAYIGGLDIIATDGTWARGENGWSDQNGIEGSFGDLTARAYNTWYHRKIPIPGALVNKTAGRWDLVAENDTTGITYTALYDNIVVTDGNGTEKKVIFRRWYDSDLNAPDIWKNGSTAKTTFTDSNGNTPTPVTIPCSRVITPEYSSDDIIVADFDVTEYPYYADNTGVYDATDAIQNALDDCYLTGGGTVWLPAGKYRVSRTVYVRNYCTLRGDWRDPDTEGEDYGTVIMAYVPANTDSTPGLIRLGGNSGAMGLTVYYPNQSASSPVAYPYTFEIPGMAWQGGNNYHLASIINCTLLNSFKGIGLSIADNDQGVTRDFGTVHAMANIVNVKGTALYRGLEAYNSSDVDLYEKIKFSNSYWANAGISYNAPSRATLDSWTRAYGIGYVLGNLEWSQFIGIECSDYSIGIETVAGLRAHFCGEFYGANVTNCNIAVNVTDLDTRWGMSFARSTLQGNVGGSPYCVKKDIAGGWVKLTDCTLTGTNSEDVNIEIYTPGTSPSSYPWKSSLPKPTSSIFFDATWYPYNADKTGTNDATSAIQSALNAVSSAGGGTVYLPAGRYRINTHLTIPANVELRGASAIPNRDDQGISKGTILMAYEGDSTATPDTDTAFITLNGSNAGIRGFRVWHPNNKPTTTVKAYPYVVRGNGSGVYIINVGFVNAYNGVDFMTNRCDNHYIKRLITTVFNKGIHVGASTEGWIEGTFSNSTVCAWTGYENWCTYEDTADIIEIMQANLTWITIEGASNEHVLDTFAYGAHDLFNIKSGTVVMWNSGSDNLDTEGYGFKVEGGTATAVNYMRYNGTTSTGTVGIYNELYIP